MTDRGSLIEINVVLKQIFGKSFLKKCRNPLEQVTNHESFGADLVTLNFTKLIIVPSNFKTSVHWKI